MTVSSEISRMDYTGNGAATVFSYTFPIFSSSDLVVSVLPVSTGVEYNMVLGTDYTISGAGEQSGGNVTLVNPLPTGDKMVIRRVLPVVQGIDIRNQGSFYPEVHEEAFDRHVMLAQQLAEEIARSVKIPITSGTNPEDYLAIAATSASNAATSETNAATSETNAATSASNAATSETNAAASAANLPNAPTAGADKYIKSNATADGWVYKTPAEVTAEVVGLTAGKAQQVDQPATATVRAATTDFTGESLEGTLSDTSVDITAFHGVAGVTYTRRCLGAGKIVAGTGLTILQGGADITTELNGTLQVYMLTSTTSEVRNYQRALDPDTAANALAGGFYGASTQDLTASRAKATTYTNTTGRPIFVVVQGTMSATNGYIKTTLGSAFFYSNQAHVSDANVFTAFVVQQGETYKIDEMVYVFTLNKWVEGRL